MKYEYVINLTKPIGTNTWDTMQILRTSDFNHYRECRILLVESLNKLGLYKTLNIYTKDYEVNNEQLRREELYITLKS
jgi:hypothetical protein